MSDYVNTMLNDVPDEMDVELLTPAASHLFKVNNVDPKLLPQDKKEIFMHLVMQGMYLSQQCHPDIRTTILFLCRRLVSPDWDDHKTLMRLVCYFRETVYVALGLGMDTLNCVPWWIDASFAVIQICMGIQEQLCLWGMGQSSDTIYTKTAMAPCYCQIKG